MIFLLKTQSSEDKIFQIDDSTTIYGNKLKTLFGERGTIILNSIAAQPRTIKELAFETGLSQQAIYYHIKK
ncbi:MAG: ArsR family transcriptional regulator, partial [Candidatus Thorarchaeota archaeon]